MSAQLQKKAATSAHLTRPAHWRACRAWRRPAPHHWQPFVVASRQQRRMQRLTAAATAEAASPKWGPESEPDYTGLMALEDAKPATSRPGYRSFMLDNCEFLVAELPDGQLDLQDSYVIDEESEDLVRPSIFGELPAGPRHYQSIEIGAEFLGNVLEEKPPKQWVYKVYFLPVARLEPYELDLAQVYVMDNKARSISKEPVVWLAPEDVAPHDLRLRVRNGTLTIESVESLPGWEEVVLANQEGLSALSEAEVELLAQAAQGAVPWDDVQAVVGQEYVRLWQAQGAEALAAAGSGTGSEAGLPPSDLPVDKLEDDGLDEDNLKDFMAEYDDEMAESDYDDFDSPAVDY
ncbi:hypothetical protein N2152v2_009002 [Parachlorella kessleri]